mgnify:CR=1 FL=1
MEITVNGRQACLKKNTSFEYISENPLFTGSDSYTLTVTFPLKDCPQNIAIFGHLHRQDVEKGKVVFDCDIRDKAFFKSGSIIITQISETEVKTQFLEGRSEQNFDDTFDDVYLNQLQLGYPDSEERMPSAHDTAYAWKTGYPARNWVALPWVNNTSGNLQNAVQKDENGIFQWVNDRDSVLTYQPFLMYILNKICEVTGYTGHFEEILDSRFRHLLICNTLPSTWGAWNFAVALPHWSLTEFFEELEKLMQGQFSINHKAKTVSFEFSHKVAYKTEDVHIGKVINKYQVEVARENKSDYLGATNLVYADNDNRFWAYQSCGWYIDEHKDDAIVFNTMSDLVAFAKENKVCGVETHSNGRGGTTTAYSRGYRRNSEAHGLFYAKDVDTYFIMWCYKSELVDSTRFNSLDMTYNWYKYTNRLMPVNQFGRRVADKEADDVELNIVPAWIDYTEENGPCLFLECGEMGDAVEWTQETDEHGNTTGEIGGGGSRSASSYNSGSSTQDDTDYNSGALAQTNTGRAIAKGEQDRNDAYFDKLYVGFWSGRVLGTTNRLPHPITDKIEVTDDFSVTYYSYSLRINQAQEKDKDGIPLKYTCNIDNKKKYTFSFLSDTIPDPRALFYIEGSRYVCEKITATFHEGTGKSQLLKGVFYRVME